MAKRKKAQRAQDVVEVDGAEYLLAAPEQEIDEDGLLHILRVGPIYDMDTGKLVLDVTEELAEEIARTTQALITEANVTLPISMEHGIERGARGDTSADVRPYGHILGVKYDKKKKGVYASKEWSAIGMNLVSASKTPNGSALRISPRIKIQPVYHPQTGELMGTAHMDVASITTLPRQDSLEPVALSREMSTQNTEQMFTNATKDDNIRTSDEILSDDEIQNVGPNGSKVETMTKKTEAKAEVEQPEVAILLARNSSEANVILGALGLDGECEAVELTRAIEGLKGQLTEAVAELSKIKQDQAEAALEIRKIEANETLDQHEIKNQAERDLYLAALLSNDPAQVEMARGALDQRGKPDNQGKINEAIEMARSRGALPADFEITDAGLVENADTVIELLGRIPDGNTVRLGEPEGSTTAGADGNLDAMDREAAGQELSNLVRTFTKENPTVSRLEALRHVNEAHPELARAAFQAVKG